jgi:hypothetical protein
MTNDQPGSAKSFAGDTAVSAADESGRDRAKKVFQHCVEKLPVAYGFGLTVT